MRASAFSRLSLLVALAGMTGAVFGQANPVAPPDDVAGAKVLEWGWDTPSAVYVRDHVREMEKIPFDGVVLTLTADGKHDLSQRAARQGNFASRAFGQKVLSREEYSEAIDALAATKFEKFTDNFLRMNVTPGDRDWFDEPFCAAENVKLLASVAKECRLKGIMLDTEAYGGQLFNYSRQPHAKEHALAEYRHQVRARGRQFMNAIDSTDPDATLIITLAYSMAHFSDDNAKKYELLPDFLDGMLEAAGRGQILYDGFEWAYEFKTEKQFAEKRELIRKTSLSWSAVPDAMKEHWRASFGLWLDYDAHWDPHDFSRNYFTPAQFAYSIHEAMRYTDRYVWIWSQAPNWWKGDVPQAYIDALTLARNATLPAPH